MFFITVQFGLGVGGTQFPPPPSLFFLVGGTLVFVAVVVGVGVKVAVGEAVGGIIGVKVGVDVSVREGMIVDVAVTVNVVVGVRKSSRRVWESARAKAMRRMTSSPMITRSGLDFIEKPFRTQISPIRRMFLNKAVIVREIRVQGKEITKPEFSGCQFR